MSDNICQGHIRFERPCPRQVVEDSTWCIFHYPNKRGDLVERFRSEFNIEYTKQIREHPDHLDFTEFDFPHEIIFFKNISTLFCSNAIFRKKVSFIADDNEELIFHGFVTFFKTKFMDVAVFDKVRFKNIVIFNEVTFFKVAKFNKVKFEDFSGFYQVHFNKIVEFNEANFRKEVLFAKTYFKNDASFLNANFHDNSSFRNVNFQRGLFRGTTFNDVIFSKAIFKKKALFRRAIFKKASFKEVTFCADVLFDESLWGDVWFTNSTFIGTTVFNYSKFCGVVEFTNSTFKGFTLFLEVVFKGNVDFRDAIFQEVWFNKSTFYCKATYDKTTFINNVQFLQINTFYFINFNNIKINSRFTIHVSKWSYIDKKKIIEEKKKSVSLVMLRDPIIKDEGKILITGKIGVCSSDVIAGYCFENFELKKIEFYNETWPIYKGRKIIADEELLKIRSDIEIENIPSSSRVTHTYRRLRENYENAKRYSEAGDFFLGEMEVLRKESPSLQLRYLYSLYYWLGKYGESIKRPVIGLFISRIVFAYFRLFFKFHITSFSCLIGFLDEFLTYFNLSPNKFYIGIENSITSLFLALIFIAIRRRVERR